ncbi:general alpha-glucoside permease [Nannizzia gypsea CBS 118893]|uniref:General alpha-glucoside permease n=1 Tax=Arthroderma gypseum (strain ATCC MYA-4604 / CBS 118893) TaxID=535722 RepID=E4UTD6_ARTGP|nr:general alpha-glucoside permease [Nannizzia gypsea CBS 118893]EFR00697.1 general alpha-glucoside permease [Nannizzia gypsea CBS 118893]
MAYPGNREDNSTSPLLADRERQSGEIWDDADAVAKQAEKEGEPKSSWYLFLLALSIGGLQIVWSVELSNGSPYLLSLGMNKSLLAFVWIAGPLTGTLVQPYIGIRSDNCRISWGKRKPFMIGGGIATVFSLLALAWVREIVGGILSLFGASPESSGVRVTIIVVATLLMYCLDFAINTVQAAIRAFIVDNAPAHQQEAANAWASRLTGIGNIIGYISGYLKLPKIFPFFGDTQFKVLCVIASMCLGLTLLTSCSYITERDPRLEGPPKSENPGVVAFFTQVFKSIRRLPPRIRKVCEVQLCAWIGWFPFLFYSTTYIGQLYVNPIFDKHPNLTKEEIDAAWEKATRIGTLALLIYAITSFIGSIVLPLLIVPGYRPAVESEASSPPANRPYLSTRPSTSTLSFTASAGAAIEPTAINPIHDPSRQGERGGGRWSSIFSRLQVPGLTLRKLWLISHILFALCMFSTIFVSSPAAGTAVIATVGLSWALTLWAPFALISAEVAQRDAEHRRQRHSLRPRTASDPTPIGSHPRPLQSDVGTHERDSEENPRASVVDHDAGDKDETVDQAGVILGIHNVSISCPQIVSTLISSVIFKALQKPRGEPWDDSVGWVLRFGGCAALGAAWFTSRMGDGASPGFEDEEAV